MPAIYADSFAGLTAARQGDDRLRQMAMDSAIQNFINTQNANKQRQLQAAQFQFNKDETAKQDTIRSQEMANKSKDEDRRYALEVAAQGTRDSELKLNRDRFDYEKNVPRQAQAREYALQLDAAEQDANEGAFGSPDEFTAKYPDLRSMANAYVDKSLRVRPVIEGAYHTSEAVSNLLNERDKTKAALDHIADTTDRAKASGMTDKQLPQLAVVPILSRRLQEIQKHIPDDKTLNNMVYFDPKAGYKPAIPAPRWMQLPQQSTATGTSASPNTGQAARPAPTQFEPQFYDRVNQLIQSGLAPVDAKRKALSERNAVSTASPSAGTNFWSRPPQALSMP